MPEKDGSEDRKSTKSVVNKKQKQFMNQEEQLDLSSVAESFGGRIVGEPVELDEDGGVFSIPAAAFIAKYGIPLAITAIGAYGTDRALKGKPITIPNSEQETEKLYSSDKPPSKLSRMILSGISDMVN